MPCGPVLTATFLMHFYSTERSSQVVVDSADLHAGRRLRVERTLPQELVRGQASVMINSLLSILAMRGLSQ